MTSVSPSFSWTQVAAWRATRHHLDARVPRRRMLNVASELCGLHAQVMSSAELTLWARVEGLGPEAVKKALWTERSLVKLWAMRGTLHLLTTADYPTWQAALSTYDHYRRPGWSRYFGVTQLQLEKLIRAVAHVLEDRELTREELADEVGRRTRSRKLGDALRESWGAVLKPCSFQGVPCFAPGEGQRVRFTNPGSWLDLDDRRRIPRRRSPRSSGGSSRPTVPSLGRSSRVGGRRLGVAGARRRREARGRLEP